MPYTPRIFRDKPDRTTPINAEALEHMQTQYSEAVADAAAAVPLQGKPGQRYQFVACTVRYVNATTWAFIDDGSHAPTGVLSVQYFSDRIRINYDFTAAKVGTLMALPDETMSTVSGIRMGPSVGLTYADIYIYSSAGGASPINPNTLTNTSGNIWIWGVMEVSS